MRKHRESGQDFTTRNSALSTSRLLLYLPAAIAFASYLLCAGCVSVDLGAGRAKRASNVVYTEPSGNFHRINNSTVDYAWQDSTNGNTLAYLSECDPKSDIPLKTLEDEYLGALDNAQVISSKELDYNNRDAIQTIAGGHVDGVAVCMEVVIFKKNDCNYTLSFVGREKYFSADEKIFQNFIQGFKAP
jgi:hypothetical protein